MRHIILHSHIFKNAGTTFDNALVNNFKKDFVDHRDDIEIINGKEKYLVAYLRKNSHIKAFSSHSIHFHPKNNNEFTFHQIYFLRHPIERIYSVYNFEKKQGPDVSLGGKMANELDFNDYVSWRMRDDVPATIRNAHTIFLSGMGPSLQNIDEMFINAKKIINSSSLIGIVDRFDDTMQVFKKILIKSFQNIELSYEIKNVTNSSSEVDIEKKASKVLNLLDSDIAALVQEKNKYDIELYKLANKRLDYLIKDVQ